MDARRLRNNPAIQSLNREFQARGGRAVFSNSGEGTGVLLSHHDGAYLEDFRIRLLVELGDGRGKERRVIADRGKGREEGMERRTGKNAYPSTGANRKREKVGRERQDGKTRVRSESVGVDEVNEKMLKSIEEALDYGATDDGQIVRRAHLRGAQERDIYPSSTS